MGDIGNLISSIGFPIVVCLIMIYNNFTTTEKLTEAVNSLKNVIYQLSAKITDEIIVEKKEDKSA